MTVSSKTRKQQFLADGVENEFTFTFRALTSTPSDIKCTITAGGVDTSLTYTTQYSVVVNSSGIGGTVTLVDPAAVGAGTLTVYRQTTNTQGSDYDDYNQFPADTVETDLDIRTMVSQEQSETFDRTLQLPVSYSGTASTLLPTPVANKIIGWNSAASALENKDSPDVSVAAALAAQAAAEAAQLAAETAETNAETAETNSETAETNAEIAEVAAEAAQAAAEAAAASLNLPTTGTLAANKILTVTAGGAWELRALLDEDNMASDSNTTAPTQQSVKAYVDTEIGAIPTSVPSIFNAYGGNGEDGAKNITADANFSDHDSAVVGRAQYTSLTISATTTLTIDTGWAFIGVSGTCTIHGTISADAQGESAGAGSDGDSNAAEGRRADGTGQTTYPGDSTTYYRGVVVAAHTDSLDIYSTRWAGINQCPIDDCVSGAGGGGGRNPGGYSGGCGGGAGSYGGAGGNGGVGSDDGDNAIATPTTKIVALTGGQGDNAAHGYMFNPNILVYRGSGGGGGANGAVGGAGGGVLYIECNELVFDGVMTADGANGSNAGHGGGGGGGGGLILIRAKILTTNTGTVTVTGGTGGSGDRSGGNGATGFKDIVEVE